MTLPAPGDGSRVRYRYHFTDFRRGRLITTLPMTGVSLSDVISGSSTGSGTVPLAAQVIDRDPFAATVTRRSVCWAERQTLDTGGQVVDSAVPWAGLVMKRTRQYAARSMKLDMITLPGYFEHRLVGDHTFRQRDKFAIFRSLAAEACQQPPVPGVTGNSPHTLPLEDTTGTTSGVLADRTYLASDLKTSLSALNELAGSGDGFDYRFVPAMGTAGDLTSLLWRVDLGYPRLGRVAPADLRWSTAREDRRQRWGFVSDLTITEDGSSVHNRITAVGAGTGADQIRATADSTDTDRDEQEAGYARFESSLNSSTSEDRTFDTVYGKAYGALISGFASEVQVTGIKVRGDLAPVVTSYALGDDLTVKIGDAVTGQPMTIVGQLIGRTIQPPERGDAERVTLDVQGTVVA